MPDVIAIIPTRLNKTLLGLPSLVGRELAGRCVLEWVVERVSRVKGLKRIVLVHEPNEDVLSLLNEHDFGVPVSGHVYPDGLEHPDRAKIAAARLWSLEAWRGGLGGATCYDELLPAGPMLSAMEEHKADSALLVGADWPLVDPNFCQRVLDLHLEHPDMMQMTFTQAPPGLAGIAVARKLIAQLAKNNAGFGQLLAYSPAKPQSDPIGRDVCVQIPAAVRSCTNRFVYDTPTTAAMIDWIADRLGDRLGEANATDVADTVTELDDDTQNGFAGLPQQVTLELTPRRVVDGPVTPHHYVKFDRPDMPIETAQRIVSQLGKDRDIALTLGGLGDALLHKHWKEVVMAAREAGVLGVAIETDLFVEKNVLQKILELPIDILSVRLNADTAATYEKAMDPDGKLDDGFAKVIANLEWLINERNRRGATLGESMRVEGVRGEKAALGRGVGLPWIVLKLVKTGDTFGDMETFFDRWMYYTGQAVIEPSQSGCGLAPQQSPVPMAPPGRFGCRQLTKRLTIHSDGQVAQCDQDWLGRACGGDAKITPLKEIWRAMQSTRESHAAGKWGELELCGGCSEWHRP